MRNSTVPAILLLVAAIGAPGAVHALAPAAGEARAAPLDPVFDCYAANSAWGLTLAGKIVDRSGRILSYRSHGRMPPDATSVDGHGYVEASALVAKFAGAADSGKVDAVALAEHLGMIDEAAGGKITSSDTGVRDAGTSTCHAYVFDAAHRRYRDVELGSDGGVADRRIVNDAPAAATLIEWLRSIGVAR
jgi:hypothetical protein